MSHSCWHEGERKRIKELECWLARKDRALAETAALLMLGKKVDGDPGRGRGRMTRTPDRQAATLLIADRHRWRAPCESLRRVANQQTDLAPLDERWSGSR